MHGAVLDSCSVAHVVKLIAPRLACTARTIDKMAVLMWLAAGAATLVALILLSPRALTPKRLLLSALECYRRVNLWRMRIRGTTARSEAEARVVSGQAWADFCDTLKAAGAAVTAAGTPSDAFTQAEGYRYLTRLVRGGLEQFIENADTEAPRFLTLVDGMRNSPVKLGLDNPSNVYSTARVRGNAEYVVRGTRGTVAILSFGYQAGNYGAPGGLKTIDTLNAADLVTDADGNFEIVVAPTRPGGGVNWLRSVADPPEGLVLVRQTHLLREQETLATMSIKLRGARATVPSKWSAEALDAGLAQCGMLVAGAPMMFARWAQGFKKHTNQLPLFDQATSDAVGGDPSIRYYHSYWALGPDEALVVEATPPQCTFWNMQINNHFSESLDYRYFNVHVNKAMATYRSDASVLIVLAHKDPGIPYANWLSTADHECGTMTFRWVKPGVPDAELPHPRARVLPFAELAAAFPPRDTAGSRSSRR